MNGSAAQQILYFLNAKKNELSPLELNVQLSKLTRSVLKESDDSSLLDSLSKSGWNVAYGNYGLRSNFDDLVIRLRMHTQNIMVDVTSRRSSEAGIKNTIKSFAPDLLMIYMLRRAAVKDDAAMAPFSEFFDGVCLLADISGFTRLSGKFCEGGKYGIDQLQQATNGYLSKLLKVVYAYGGDVMKFAGDALVCVFQPIQGGHGGRKLTLSDVCTNAVRCATELSQICTDQLTIHVAVTCGPICLAMLGGHNDLWECLISGGCLGHLSQCLDEASSKQTVVTPQFVEALGPLYRDEINIKKLPSGNYLVMSAIEMTSLVARKMIKRRTSVLMKDAESRFSVFPNEDKFLHEVSKFVPLPVSMGLMSGSFDYLAELREVTTMFMSWDSYDEIKHRDLLSLQEHFTTAQEVLASSGGFIRQFLIDDKGCVLIACWGVPTASHPDNTRRALCAGAIIGYKLDELGMKTSVGITTGNVFCGSVGSHVRREYAVIGDVVNLAARLMSKAKHRLLLDESTYISLPLFLKNHVEKLEPMVVKGRDKPITAYCLKRTSRNISLTDKDDNEMLIDTLTKPAPFKRPILLGIEECFAGPVILKNILVEGRMGSTNNDLSDWLKTTGERLEIRILTLQMIPKNSSKDYYVVTQLFRLLVREENFDVPYRQKFIVKNILMDLYKHDVETARKVAYPAMRIALGVTCPLYDTDTSKILPHLPPRLINQCLKEIFIYLLNDIQVVICMEYSHNIDKSSWNVLLNLAGTTSRALIIYNVGPVDEILSHSSVAKKKVKKEAFIMTVKSFSTERLHVIYKRLLQLDSTILVRMYNYTVTDVDDLLRSALNRSCPNSLALMVHRLSGGDPFWCREMALFIKSTGATEFMQAMNPLKSSFALIESISQKELSLGNPNSNSFFSKTKSMLKPILTLSNIIRNQEHTPLSRTTSFKSVESDSSTTGSFSTPKRKSYDCVLKDSMRELVGERCNNAKDRNQGQSSEVDTLTTSKLELFIVCRFGKLSSEDQNLLRIASIIGLSFSSEILFGLLSPKMRYQMETSVQSLKEKSWILDSIEEDGEYVFVHPLFHQTLYDLTPAGDRAKLHASVASFILEVHDEDPTYFSQLGHHYSLSVESRPKAFEYFVRASIFSIVKGPNYCESGLKLLSHARSFADGAVDCECALGIIEEQRNKIIALKMEMIKTETGTPTNVKTPISTSKAIFNFRNLRVTPKSAEDQDNMCQTHQMTSDELAAIQDLFEAAELEYHEAYEEYMNQNVVGVAVKWQLPFTKRFDSHKKGRRRSTLYRKNSIWDLRIEDISSEFAKIRNSFLRRQSLRRESMNKLAEEIKTNYGDDSKLKLSDKAKNALADEVGEEEGGGGGGEHEAIDNDDVKNDEKDKRVIKKKRQNVDRRRSSFLDSILSRKPSAGIVRKPTPESLTDGGGRTTHSCLIS